MTLNGHTEKRNKKKEGRMQVMLIERNDATKIPVLTPLSSRYPIEKLAPPGPSGASFTYRCVCVVAVVVHAVLTAPHTPYQPTVQVAGPGARMYGIIQRHMEISYAWILGFMIHVGD
jgi:hypothetical protein